MKSINQVIQKIPLEFSAQPEISKENLGVTVYFIRHGQGYHNVKTTPNRKQIRDPILTALGIQQARDLKLKFKQNKVQFDLVIISPLTRAIQTALIIFDDMNSGEFIINANLQEDEAGILPSNTGRDQLILKKEFLNLNFDLKNKWYIPKNDVKERAYIFMKELSQIIKETNANCVAVIGHALSIKAITKQKYIDVLDNCGYHCCEFKDGVLTKTLEIYRRISERKVDK